MLKNKIKIIRLQIFLMSILVVGLSGCGCKNSFENDQSMFNDIIHSTIKPDHILKIKNDNLEVDKIISRYFEIGESREEVVFKLSKMSIKPIKESQDEIKVYGAKGNAVFLCKDDDKTIEISFQFDNSNKLSNIKSRYFRRE